MFTPKKINAQDVDPSLVQLAQIFGAKIPLELNPMPEGVETPTTLFGQLHYWLEGKYIPVGEIPELNIPLDYFFDGILQHNSRKVAKIRCPLDTSFLVWGEFFPLPTGIEMAVALQ
jgi:hypothetical protein